ncbi:uncharacterized protein [Diadema setosum]|uniref:uncharacterized protein n=1 Tax=Diadema setosum TaxID=31175 RepID=UPI003B3B61EB
MNGKALCLMPMQAFRDRAPECGDILYELFQKLFRKECRFYHSSGERDQGRQRSSPDNQPYYDGSKGSRTDQLRLEGMYHGNTAQTSTSSSPRLPIDLSAPDKSSTPCSDSGHSSPDMAEDLRLPNTTSASTATSTHIRRHNAPPMITLTPTSRASKMRIYDKHMRILGWKNLQDAHESAMDDDVPASPTKRVRYDYPMHQHSTASTPASIFPQLNGHIELRHRTDGLQQDRHSEGLHPMTASRLLVRRMSSDDGSTAHGSSASYLTDRAGPIGVAYHQGAAVHVPCTIPSLAGDSAVISRLQHRRNSTGGTEGLPRRRSVDLDDVFLMDDDAFETRKAAGGDCRLLWDFLVQLLKNKTYTPYIRWEDQNQRVFRILDPVQIANLWGLQKNRTNMTYEKLSRALRYYYKMGILQKEQGQKLTYRFLQDPKDIANSQRFSKLSRNKDAADHHDVDRSSPSSTSPPVHAFPSASSSSSQSASAVLSSSSLPNSSLPSSLPSSIPPSSISSLLSSSSHDQRNVFTNSGLVASDGRRVHAGSPCQRSPHAAPSISTSSTPATLPDDPVALATHQSIEGVSMMALTSPWPTGGLGSNVEGHPVQGLKVKEEPNSRSSSPGTQT